jgi:hypothetical protein
MAAPFMARLADAWALPLALGMGFWPSGAQASDAAAATACQPGERWDVPMAMCMPAVDEPGQGTRLSASLTAFGVASEVPGPRGASGIAAPNHFMIGVTRAAGTHGQLSLDLMGTVDLWSYPRAGYPELLQVGEQRADGEPYIDAQHPHSSPIMGLTLGYAFAFGATRSLRFSFAPRGASTDGPVAFMHRASARDNPDAPLGHHVGQDVGHISSTVLAAQLVLGRATLEASAFNGMEPAPTHVDLPMGRLDSGAARVALQVAPTHRLTASMARVRQGDEAFPGSEVATRWSASWQDDASRSPGHGVDHTFLLGLVGRDRGAGTLRSALDEGTVSFGRNEAWWRLEAVQRLPRELGLAGSEGHWVQVMTLGATRWSVLRPAWQLGLGASLSADHLPSQWSAADGGRTPLTVRLIVQLRAQDHWQH